MDNTQNAFLHLLRAGLWCQDVKLLSFNPVSFNNIYRLAEEHSVVGLITAGLEHVVDISISKEYSLQFIGNALQLEQRNILMNAFIREIIGGMRKKDIYVVLVKGQGVAQCYERPLWRASGDVDLILNETNYNTAKEYFKSLASKVDEEDEKRLHIAYTVGQWIVELHGTMRSGLWRKADKGLDRVQNAIFEERRVRSWINGDIQIFLPDANEDVVYTFSHILQHFYRGGIGLRQVCDWCRLLWVYRESIDSSQLESRIIAMDMMTEWKSFAALAVNCLGMPSNAMPLYDTSVKWKKKAQRVLDVIMSTGNFGMSKDFSYKQNNPLVIRLVISLWRHSVESITRALIFPIDSLKMWAKEMSFAGKAIVKGKIV